MKKPMPRGLVPPRECYQRGGTKYEKVPRKKNSIVKEQMLEPASSPIEPSSPRQI
jgi:hypothetical protein